MRLGLYECAHIQDPKNFSDVMLERVSIKPEYQNLIIKHVELLIDSLIIYRLTQEIEKEYR